jgi:hydrogenase assembly chaperone HypC/HupF
MCIGIPLQVIECDEQIAVCEADGRRERLNIMLVGPQAAGTWVLAFQGSAIRVISADEAQQTRAALAALDAARNGSDDLMRSSLTSRRANRRCAPSSPSTGGGQYMSALAATTCRALHPLLEQLVSRHGFTALDADSIDEFIDAPGRDAGVHGGPAAQGTPTCGDRTRGRPRVAGRFPSVLYPAVARKVAPRFGFARWPALVMLRDGAHVGAIDGLRNWDEYLAETQRLLDSEPTRPPSVGIAVRSAAWRRLRLWSLNERLDTLMKSFPLPIRMVGAGSQVEEEEMQYLDMPRDMRTFEMPRVPETVTRRRCSLATCWLTSCHG